VCQSCNIRVATGNAQTENTCSAGGSASNGIAARSPLELEPRFALAAVCCAVCCASDCNCSCCCGGDLVPALDAEPLMLPADAAGWKGSSGGGPSGALMPCSKQSDEHSMSRGKRFDSCMCRGHQKHPCSERYLTMWSMKQAVQYFSANCGNIQQRGPWAAGCLTPKP
jgi:hypothetical protein